MYRLNSLKADIQLIVDGAWESEIYFSLMILEYIHSSLNNVKPHLLLLS